MLKNEDELAGVLGKILSAGQSKDDENCLSHYIRLFDSVDFSHVVVVSPMNRRKSVRPHPQK